MGCGVSKPEDVHAATVQGPAKLRSQDKMLRCGKRVEGDFGAVSPRNALAPVTPEASRKRPAAGAGVGDLPDELVATLIMCKFKATELRDLCALSSASRRFRDLGSGVVLEAHWRRAFSQTFGPEISIVHEGAAKLAGSWKRLYAARTVACREAAPFQKPSRFEVESAVRLMVAPNGPTDGADGAFDDIAVVFLIDGSGSVSEADFSHMQEFMRTAANIIAAREAPADGASADDVAAPAAAGPKLSIIQFSSDVRVELPPTALSPEAFGAAVDNIHRMNGGTNVAAALQKAGQLLKPLGPRCRRVLAILTDARVDDYQAREAQDMAARLADEQRGVSLHAFGVGRGVCAADMLRLIGAEGADGAQRYLALHVDEAAPW